MLRGKLDNGCESSLKTINHGVQLSKCMQLFFQVVRLSLKRFDRSNNFILFWKEGKVLAKDSILYKANDNILNCYFKRIQNGERWIPPSAWMAWQLHTHRVPVHSGLPEGSCPETPLVTWVAPDKLRRGACVSNVIWRNMKGAFAFSFGITRKRVLCSQCLEWIGIEEPRQWTPAILSFFSCACKTFSSLLSLYVSFSLVPTVMATQLRTLQSLYSICLQLSFLFYFKKGSHVAQATHWLAE